MSHETNSDPNGEPRLELDSSLSSQTARDSSRSASTAADDPSSRPSYGSGNGNRYDDVPREGIHLTDYVRVLSKRRWTAATAFLLVFGFTALQTFTATPVYEARLQILIEAQNPNVVSFEEVLLQSQRPQEYYQTQHRILRSRQLARRTLEAGKLWKDPALVGGPQSKAIPLNPMTWVGNAVGFVRELFVKDTPNEPADATETAAQARAVDAFLGSVKVEPVRTSQLVDIVFSSTDPKFAARGANALGQSYIEQNIELRFTASKEASDFLGKQMAEQRSVVEASEQALQQYREQTASVSLEERQDIVVKRMGDLNTAVTKAQNERIQKETAYQQVRATQSDRKAVDTIPAVLTNGFIQQLKGQLGELQRTQAQLAEKFDFKHPEMLKVQTAIQSTEAKLNSEIGKVIDAIRIEYESAVTEERSLIAALKQQERDALDLSRQSIQYGVLQRDATSNKQLFDGLLQRARETGITGELRTSNVRIVDPAEVPRRPARPAKRKNLLLGVLGGLIVGLGLAFFFEYLDSRIKNPDEIRQHLGLAFLGLVPALPAKSGRAGTQLIDDGVPPGFAESFRSLRTNLLFSMAEEGSRSIVVTSTAPGEGKTVVASNLAMALAMSGERVLLIDADMRRPRLHEVYGGPQKPGLSDILVANAKASDAVRKTSTPGLWLLPAGEFPPNPAELLGSRRCKDLLAALGDSFHWVIIDTPPVMAVTDSSVVAHRASGVLFVVGSEMTSRGLAQRAVEQLDRAKARFFGAVLNRVDLQHNAYYYSHYYRREYTQHYQPAGPA